MTRDQRRSVDLTKPLTLRVAEPGAIPRLHVTAPHPRDDGLVHRCRHYHLLVCIRRQFAIMWRELSLSCSPDEEGTDG